jgi:hypothetical protein
LGEFSIRRADCLSKELPMSEPATLAPPLALTGFLPAWDIERRRADLTPIADWALEHIRHMGHPVASLSALHRHLGPSHALAVTTSLTAASLDPKLRGHVRRAVAQAIPELPLERVWIQSRAHFRILVPNDTVAPVPPHTDFGFGHTLVERNVWFSLTDAEGPSALHLLPLADSLAWMSRTGRLYGVLDGAPDIPPVPTRAGDVLLFTPLHVHRARAPSEDRCRVSVDVRLVPVPATMVDLTFSPLESER